MINTLYSLTQYADLIRAETRDYKATLPLPDPAWPVDIWVFAVFIHRNLFKSGMSITIIRQQYGLLDHNISSRFARYAEIPPKAYILRHRIELAKRLLRLDQLRTVSIGQVALAVGYERPHSLTMTFKRHTGFTPSAYREFIKHTIKEECEVANKM